MNLTQKLKKSYEIVIADMNSIFEVMIQTILGENGLKKIDDYLIEFFLKFQEEAMSEAEKYEKVCYFLNYYYFMFK